MSPANRKENEANYGLSVLTDPSSLCGIAEWGVFCKKAMENRGLSVVTVCITRPVR